MVLEDFFWLRDLYIFMELNRRVLLFRMDVVFLIRLPTFRLQPLTSGQLREERLRRRAHRHDLEVEDERHLKDFVAIFLFIEVLCNV
jgi:hypothetical protein